jgi:ribosomal protein S18 acetylase RimI-like enzyme
MPKLPKVKEFCHLNIKKMERSDTTTLGTLVHFRHFRHFGYFKFASIPPLDFEGILSDNNKQTMTRIIHAQTPDHYEWVRKLFQQYAEFLGFDLEFQGFSEELANLPGDYSPPQGCILMAVRAEEFVGCVALRPLEDRICEMKRLFVLPGLRGRKIGQALARGIIDEARTRSYERMRLDTIEFMTEAKQLYRSLGFRPIKPYRYNPLDNPTYFELDLRE